MTQIVIQATYVGNQKLVSVLEGNLDLDHVTIERNEHAIKAIFPLDLVIAAASAYAFEKLVLAPLLDPIAEKFDWTKAVKRYLNPVQPFTLTVKIREEDVILEAALGTDQDLTAQVWRVIKDTLDILKRENRLRDVSKIRFVPGRSGVFHIFCYENNQPEFMVDLFAGKTCIVFPDLLPLLQGSNEGIVFPDLLPLLQGSNEGIVFPDLLPLLQGSNEGHELSPQEWLEQQILKSEESKKHN